MPTDTDDGVPIRRHTRKSPLRKFTPAIIAAGMGGAVFLGVMIFVVIPLVFTPRADAQGKEWTLDQLGAHLKSKGVITTYEVHKAERNAFIQGHPFLYAKTPKGETVRVYDCGGAIAAEEKAASMTAPTRYNEATQVATWGRFLAKSTTRSEDYIVKDVFRPLPGAMLHTVMSDPEPIRK